MELFLNLIWFALALGAFGVLARRHQFSVRTKRSLHGTDVKALLALFCVLVLLFPVVSASDDLHPSQAVLEDATKKIQHSVASLNPLLSHEFSTFVPTTPELSWLFGLSLSGRWQPAVISAKALDPCHRLSAGRAPPALFS
jgi:hypothetical protein